ncbi:hypothetical protein CK215_22090 [Mesorhizobium sp. WSM3864]|nr:hypothetical protein CK215_22090 [Mesorhizobium sp. WSM3864]
MNDKAFILGVASDEYRKRLLKLENDGFLEFANGGGITTLLQQIQPIVNPRGVDWHRTATLIDSDALQPGAPSHQSLAVLNFCAQHSLWCHQLQRRSIENYLPREILRGWAYTGKAPQKRKVFEAFVGMSSSQREHYNMKTGFQGDEDRQGPNCGTLYHNIVGATRASLMNGFGSHIAKLYSSEAISQDHLRRDGSENELRSLVTEILAMAR